MKVLVIVAHPDDEVLGVGATLFKHVSKGDEVYICIVTKAYEPQWDKQYMDQKIEEQVKVDKLIGVKKRFNLDLPTVKLNTIAHGELNKKILDVVNEVKPEIIYTHFEDDVNFDHTLIFRAVLVAVRPPQNIKLICFEIPSETEWGKSPFNPNHWVDIKDFIEKKVQAFSVYKSEVKEYPHPRSLEGIRNLAKKRGNEICKEFAEAFVIVRNYW